MKVKNILFRGYHYLSHRLKGVPHSVLRKAGAGFYCAPGAHFRPGEDIRIGGNVHIGKYAHIAAPCVIGDDVMLASFVSFVGGDHRFRTSGVLIKSGGKGEIRPIVIEEDAWIGHGSIVLAGVRIGRGSIIAAGSVVTADVPPCTIWGCPPARFMRDRFQSEEEKLRHLEFLERRYAKQRQVSTCT